jgi:hypothetical protein
MKTLVCLPLELSCSARAKAGFTLAEALTSATLFVLLLGGLVSANLFGMRMFEIAESKLRAESSVRKALGLLGDEIRKCNSVWVGNVTNGTFVALLDGEPQSGSALLIQQSTNATNFVVYYVNAADQSLRRMASSTATTTLLAEPVTNNVVFSAQDCLGNILTNSQSDRVIHAALDLVQPQPWLPAGEYSKLETSVTRRINN